MIRKWKRMYCRKNVEKNSRKIKVASKEQWFLVSCSFSHMVSISRICQTTIYIQHSRRGGAKNFFSSTMCLLLGFWLFNGIIGSSCKIMCRDFIDYLIISHFRIFSANILQAILTKKEPKRKSMPGFKWNISKLFGQQQPLGRMTASLFQD